MLVVDWSVCVLHRREGVVFSVVSGEVVVVDDFPVLDAFVVGRLVVPPASKVTLKTILVNVMKINASFFG